MISSCDSDLEGNERNEGCLPWGTGPLLALLPDEVPVELVLGRRGRTLVIVL